MVTPAEQSEAGFAAESYDYVPLYASRADQAFYADCARAARGSILELGCGTGRILVPTAAAGGRITGLDASRAMLARCRERLEQQPGEVQGRVRLVEGRMTDFALEERFALVTIPFRGFQHLIRVDDQMACLRAVHRHLADGGQLVFDVFQVKPEATFDPEWMREREDTPETALPDGRRFRRTSRVTAFHRAEQYNEIEFAYYVTHADGRRERLTQRFAFRYFYPYELEHLLARCGFRIRGLFGDFDRSPLRDDSPEIILIAEKG